MPQYRLDHAGNRVPADAPRPRNAARRLRSTAAWQTASAATIARQPWCAVCGATNDLTADHITPLHAGGHPLHPSNLRTLCRRCNSRKGARG
jgi:5-methylcytosine-specific restriction endonuclease McrA